MTTDEPGTEMMDPNSWIQLHICNHRGQCCTSQELKSLLRGDLNYRGVGSTDPCSGLVMEKRFPNDNGQTVEIEHFGGDGTTLENIYLFLEYATRIQCDHPNSPAEKIVLADGARERLLLKCSTLVVVP